VTARPLQPPRPRAAAAVLRRGGRVLLGLAAAVALAVLLVGVPYGLARWVGWPLPHHWPTWAQTKSTLTGPFTDQIMLDTLACLCWLVWAVFALDTLRALPDALADARDRTARGPLITHEPGDGRRTGPLRAIATVLLATILAGLLSLRPHPGPVPGPINLAGPATRPTTVVTAIQTPLVTTQPETVAAVAAHAAAQQNTPRGTVTVRQPRDGIHDSLWRIAQRSLGDGNRWPEIYRLNRGLPQADGPSLQTPSLIQPGWVLRLPSTAGHAPSGPQAHRRPASARPSVPGSSLPPTSTPAPSLPGSAGGHLPSPTAQPGATAPSSPPDPDGSPEHSHASPGRGDRSSGSPGGGLDLGDGVFVSVGLAAAISAAVVAQRRRRRRTYEPGSGYRGDLLPLAPTVRSLHLAHLRLSSGAPEVVTDVGYAPRADSDEADGGDRPEADQPVTIAEQPRPAGASAGDAARTDHVHLPARDPLSLPNARQSRTRRPAGAHEPDTDSIVTPVVGIATSGGLGLAGPGAADAARGMLLELLARAAQRSPQAAGLRLLVCEQLRARLDIDPPPNGHDMPRARWITADMGEALATLDAVIADRTRLHDESIDATTSANDMRSDVPGDGGPVVLMAAVPAATDEVARLQAVLDNGVAVGVGAVLLGQWRAGSSMYVDTDGRVSSTSPGTARPLLGTRLPTLTVPATRALLDTLTAQQTPASAPSTARIEAVSPTDRRTSPNEDNGDARDALGESTRLPEGRYGTDQPARVHRRRTDPSDALDAAPGMAAVHPADAAQAPAVPQTAATTATMAMAGLGLRVLGPVELIWQPQTAGADPVLVRLGPRQRELLVLLALHPDGTRRERVVGMLWPDGPTERPFNALNTIVGRLRRAVQAATGGTVGDVVRTEGERCLLDASVVAVDYAWLRDGLDARRSADDEQARARACRQILDAYTGDLGEGVAADWIETPREAVRRNVLDAAVTLARHLAPADTEQALDLLERARSLDPYSEPLYRDIMRLQHRLGRASSIEQTLNLLTLRLAELEAAPDQQTVELARRLAQPAPQNPAADSPASRRVDAQAPSPAQRAGAWPRSR